MAKSKSNRILSTPSSYAKQHFLYVQEVGSLTSMEPHISKRQNLNSYLFFIVTSGKGNFSYRNKAYALIPGNCVWIDCRLPYSHESSVEDPWTLMWVHFNGEQARDYYQYFLEQGNQFLFTPSHPVLFTDALAALHRAQTERTSLTELISNQYLTDIITHCFRENKAETENNNSMNDKLLQVHAYLELHAAERLTLQQVSELFFISKYHLAREYKRVYGTTIGNSITAQRVSLSKSLLRFTAKPIEQIAYESGFQDSAYFIKVFKKAESMTPLEYRKKW